MVEVDVEGISEIAGAAAATVPLTTDAASLSGVDAVFGGREDGCKEEEDASWDTEACEKNQKPEHADHAVTGKKNTLTCKKGGEEEARRR